MKQPFRESWLERRFGLSVYWRPSHPSVRRFWAKRTVYWTAVHAWPFGLCLRHRSRR